MKKILFIICLCATQIYSFGQWTEINTPTVNYFNNSYFVDDSLGFIFGPNGTIYRTVNSGTTWDSLGTTYIYSWLNNAHFVNELEGYVAGGANFPFPPSSVSDLILKTTDGGMTWDSIYGTYSGSDIIAMDFADEDNGMFVSSYVSYKTSDGGVTIDTLGLDFNNTISYGRDVEFPSLNSAYAIIYQNNTGPNVNDLYILKSTNQGDDWQLIVIDNMPSNSTKIDFTDDNNGFLIAQGGRFYKTIDGANTWSKQLIDTSIVLSDIKFINQNLGFIVAQVDTNSYLYITEDGGVNWLVEEIATGVSIHNITLGEKFIFANSTNQLFKRSIASFNVGIKDVHNTLKLQVSPNPTTNSISFEWLEETKNLKVQLTNQIGQIVLQQSIQKGINHIDPSNLANGVYTLVISDLAKPIAFSRVVKK